MDGDTSKTNGVLTVAEAARQLKVSATTLQREMREGKLIGIRVRGCYRIRQSDLDAYIEQLCQSASEKTARASSTIKCASNIAVSALSTLYRPAPLLMTRGKSKIDSALRSPQPKLAVVPTSPSTRRSTNG